MSAALRRLAAGLASLAVLVAAAGCGGSGSTATSSSTAGPEQALNGPPGTATSPAVGTGAGGTATTPVHVAPSRQAVPVLMYHVVAAPPAGARLPGLWVPPDAFRRQVAALAAAGFQAVTLDTVLNAWRGRARLPAHPIVMSFDDGYLSQGLAAATALRARRWPGVLNLVLHNLGTPGGLTAGRIKTMIGDGWEIDAHTIDHLDLTTLDAAGLRHQIAGSRAIIRRRFGVPADAFCYPAGKFDATVEAAVRAAGYRAATTELPGAARPGGDRYALPRIRVNGTDDAAAVVHNVQAALGSGA